MSPKLPRGTLGPSQPTTVLYCTVLLVPAPCAGAIACRQYLATHLCPSEPHADPVAVFISIQADRLQEEIASLHHYHQVMHKAWRAWVVAWCRAASARVLAAQHAAKRKAAVLAAFADTVRHQRHKRAAAMRAETFRRARLLLLCVRWWRGWARYSRALQSAGDEVQASACNRVLREVFGAWQSYTRFRAWKAEAAEAAEGFYWSRLATTVLAAWRQSAAASSTAAAAVEGFSAARQQRLLGAMLQHWQRSASISRRLSAAVDARRQRLLLECTQGWWTECVGNKRAFEMQVQGLVRLVTAAFKAWQQLVMEQRQQQQQHPGSSLPAHGSDIAGDQVPLLQDEPKRPHQRPPQGLQQQQHEFRDGVGVEQRPQGQQQQQLVLREQDQQLLRQALTGWWGFVGLRKMWRTEAPVLAAAYYQGKLLKRAWAAWSLAHQLDEAEPQHYDTSRAEQEQQQQLKGEQQQQQGACAGLEGQDGAALCVELQQECQDGTAEAGGFMPCAEPSLQDILHPSASHSSNRQHHAAAAAAAAMVGGGVADVDIKAAAATGKPATAVILAAAEADVDAWRSWQYQQQEQQLEAIQLAAAEQHHAGSLLRRVFGAWFAAAAAGAALMSQQAQLKHTVQLQLVQAVKQQQLVSAHRMERLLERPFSCWLQMVQLKTSAASGFRSYQLLFKCFLGWREVVLQQQHRQQLQEQQPQLPPLPDLHASQHNEEQQAAAQPQLQVGSEQEVPRQLGKRGPLGHSQQQQQQHDRKQQPHGLSATAAQGDAHQQQQQQSLKEHRPMLQQQQQLDDGKNGSEYVLLGTVLQQQQQEQGEMRQKGRQQQQNGRKASDTKLLSQQQQEQRMQPPLRHQHSPPRLQQQQQQLPTSALLQTTSQPQPTGRRAASQQQQQQQQQQGLSFGHGLLLEGDGGQPQVLPGPSHRHAQQQALPPTQKQQQQLAAAVVTATAVSTAAAAAAAAAVEACDDDMAQCGPLQLEDSGFSSQHTLTGLELTASEAAFAEEHSNTARPAWQTAQQHPQHKHPPAAGAYHQQQQAPGAVAASAMSRCGVLPGTHGVPQGQLAGLKSSAAPAAVGGGVLLVATGVHADGTAVTAEAAGFCARQFLAMSGAAPGVGGLQSPPGSTGGYDPTFAAAAAAVAAGAHPAGAAAAAAKTGFGAGAVAQQQQQGSVQGCRGDDDLRSSFGDFGCLQDLQSILDTC